MGVHAILLWVLLCHSNHRFFFSQPHKDALTPSPPANKAKLHHIYSYNALIYNIKQAGQFFSQQVFLQNCSMTACVIATDDVCIHHQCQQSIFPLRNRFYACLIIFNNIETHKGLTMINRASMPPQLTVKPSYYTSASTKALMVQHPYQAWLPCRLMI